MAQFKASMPVVAKRTPAEGAATTFSDGLKVAKLMSVGLTPSQSNVKLYGDDGVAEEDNRTSSYAVALNTTHLPTEVAALIFGAEIKKGEDGKPTELIYREEDEAPEVAFGYIDVHKIDKQEKVRVVWLPRVKFALPAETSNTRGETTTFSTPSIPGTATKDDFSGEVKHEYYFDTAEAAITQLKTLAGIK